MPNATSRSLICACVVRREIDLHRLGRGAQALERLRVDARVVAVRVQERLGHALGDRHVEVVAAEEAVAGGRQDLEDVAREVEQRAVERAAAEVVDRDPLLGRSPEPVRQRRRRGLVDDAEDLEPGHAPGHLGRGALQLVEVGGHGDDRALDPLAERPLGDLLGAREDERADLGQRVLAARGRRRAGPWPGPSLISKANLCRARSNLLALPRPADEALDARDGVLRVDDAPLLGPVADEHLAARMERHDARQQPAALLVGQHVDAPAPHAGRDGVGGAQVDSNDRHRDGLA